MSDAHTRFVYVTYIRTTPEKLWAALTLPEFTKQYWFGVTMESDWKPGSDWKMMYADGRVTDSGEIIEADAPRRLVIKWRNEWKPEFKAEGYSRCTMEIEPTNGVVKLTVTHEMEIANARMINEGVSTGWPMILSNLKTLLETGESMAPAKP